MKYILALIFIFSPPIINALFIPENDKLSTIHCSLSQIGIIFVILYRLFQYKTKDSKQEFILLCSFIFVLIADIIYSYTFQIPERESLGVVYVSELFYTLFVLLLLIYLFSKLKSYIFKFIPLTITIITCLAFGYLSFKFVLLPFYFRESTPVLFHLINSTIYALAQIMLVGLVMSVLLINNDTFENLFLEVILLFCISDFALRYQTISISDRVFLAFQYGWEISMSSIFVLFLFLKGKEIFPKSSFTNYLSIRTLLSISIIFALLLFMAALHIFNLYKTGDAFYITNILLLWYGITFIANKISIYISKKVLSINLQMLNIIPNLNSIPSSDIKSLDFKPVQEVTQLYEIDFLINKYNQLIKGTNQLSSMLCDALKKAAIGQTAQMMAHDVRKPFTLVKSILSMFDMFKSNPSELNKAKGDIDKSIRQVESMISDIMDYSREVKLETAPQGIVGILDFTIRQTAQNYKEKQIDFKYEIHNQLKPLVDNERLSRVFGNIIGNGIEAITIIGKKDQGSITIKTKDADNFVEISIANDGPPFNEEDIPKLFESFFTKGKSKGTGLGLASVQKIVNLHGGQIEARNLPTKIGVEFVIKLPASTEPEKHDLSVLPKSIKDILFVEPKADESKLDTLIKEISSSNPSIKMLLLEDEPLYKASVRNTIKSNTELHKTIVLYEAKYVDDAIELIEKEKITHAIVDIDLSEVKNGFDFLKIASERFPALKSMVHSNRTLEEDKLRAKSLNAKAYVPKPLNLENLVTFLAEGIKETKKDYGKKIVLYSDDSIIMRKGLENILKKIDTNIEKHIFTNAEDLYNKAQTLTNDFIVFTDQNMGDGMTGLDLTLKLRNSGKTCKIYIITNESQETFEPEALKAGANGMIPLPLDENKIRNYIS